MAEDSPQDWQEATLRRRRFDLSTSQALWNRSRLDLRSDEVLAQILDRGELAAWREIYRLASGPGEEAAELRLRPAATSAQKAAPRPP